MPSACAFSFMRCTNACRSPPSIARPALRAVEFSASSTAASFELCTSIAKRSSSTVIFMPGLSPHTLGFSRVQRTVAVTSSTVEYFIACMSSSTRRSVMSFVTEAGQHFASARSSKITRPLAASTLIAPW